MLCNLVPITEIAVAGVTEKIWGLGQKPFGPNSATLPFMLGR